MGTDHDSSPFLFPSTFRSYPSESTPSSSQSRPPSPSPSFCSSWSNSSFNSPYKSATSLPRSLLSHSSSRNFPAAAIFGPCAACKFHNRRCSEKCYLASFFPPYEAHNFAVVDSVFGSGNVVSFLQQKCNSSYIPLLFLLRDTRREDGQVHSDDLAQRISSSSEKSLSVLNLSGSFTQLQNDVVPLVTAAYDPNESPNYMDTTPGTVNFDVVDSGAAKERKTLATAGGNRLLVAEVDFFSDDNNNRHDNGGDGHNSKATSVVAVKRKNSYGEVAPSSSLDHVNTGLHLHLLGSDQSMVDHGIINKRSKNEFAQLQAKLQRVKAENHKLTDMLTLMVEDYAAVWSQLLVLMEQDTDKIGGEP